MRATQKNFKNKNPPRHRWRLTESEALEKKILRNERKSRASGRTWRRQMLLGRAQPQLGAAGKSGHTHTQTPQRATHSRQARSGTKTIPIIYKRGGQTGGCAAQTRIRSKIISARRRALIVPAAATWRQCGPARGERKITGMRGDVAGRGVSPRRRLATSGHQIAASVRARGQGWSDVAPPPLRGRPPRSGSRGRPAPAPRDPPTPPNGWSISGGRGGSLNWWLSARRVIYLGGSRRGEWEYRWPLSLSPGPRPITHTQRAVTR